MEAPSSADALPASNASQMATQILDLGAATQSAATTTGEGVLQVLNGTNAGRELPLTKNLTTIGKPGVQVAVITRRPHGYFITHVEGGSFPLLNGRALDAQAHRLSDQDVIQIAGVKMSFFTR